MIDFLEVEKSVEKLKRQLVKGQIDERTFERFLLDLVDVAEDGYYWMFGHESEQWYRHNGEKWIARHPGEMFVLLADIDSPEPEETLKTKWQSVQLGWFIVSLIVLAVIGGIIYYYTTL
jgi:hypothetical protein